MDRLALMAPTGALLALIACGGGEGAGPDAAGVDATPATPGGQYVISHLTVPRSPSEAAGVGLDLAGSAAPDNALGAVLATLDGLGIDTSTTVNNSLWSGTAILLADLEATALDATALDAATVSFEIGFGADPDPAACTDPADLASCGWHLQGDATFGLAPDSPSNPALVGAIVAGTLTAGPGTTTILLPLVAGAAPLRLDLIGARVEVDVSTTGLMSGKLAGAITMADAQDLVLPALAARIAARIAADCTIGPPDCCADAGSTGALILSVFDTNADCVVPMAEVAASDSIGAVLLQPDVDLLDGTTYGPDTDGIADSLSLGLGVTAVTASFPRR